MKKTKQKVLAAVLASSLVFSTMPFAAFADEASLAEAAGVTDPVVIADEPQVTEPTIDFEEPQVVAPIAPVEATVAERAAEKATVIVEYWFWNDSLNAYEAKYELWDEFDQPVGEPASVKRDNFPGYVLNKDLSTNLKENVPAEGLTLKLFFDKEVVEAEKATVTVERYIDYKGDGNYRKASPKDFDTFEAEVGSTAEAPEYALGGYVVNTEKSVLSGTVGENGLTLQVYYDKEVAATAKATVTVERYIDYKGDGNYRKASPKDFDIFEAEVGSIAEAPEYALGGYVVNTAKSVLSGTVGENGLTLQVYYDKEVVAPKTATVTVERYFQWDDGTYKMGKPNETFEVKVGDKVRASRKPYTGYVVNEKLSDQTVEVTGNTLTLKVYYDKEVAEAKKATVTVKRWFEMDNGEYKMGEPNETYELEVGSKVRASRKPYTGYVVNEEKSDQTLVVPKNGLTLNVYYDKEVVAPKTATVTVERYFQWDDGTYKMGKPNETYEVEVGSKARASRKAYTGYTVNEAKSSQTEVVPAEGLTLKVYYDKTEVAPEKTTVIVERWFERENGEYKMGKPYETYEVEVGSKVRASRKAYTGYVVNEEKSDQTVEATAEGLTLKVYYDKEQAEAPKTATVTVERYFQWDNGEYKMGKPNETYEVEVGSKVRASRKAYTGYTVNEALSDQTVAVPTEGLTLKVYYDKTVVAPEKTTVTVERWFEMDNGEYKMGEPNETYEVEVGSRVRASRLAYTGYVVNEEKSDQTVEATADGLTLKVYYDKVKDSDGGNTGGGDNNGGNGGNTGDGDNNNNNGNGGNSGNSGNSGNGGSDWTVVEPADPTVEIEDSEVPLAQPENPTVDIDEPEVPLTEPGTAVEAAEVVEATEVPLGDAPQTGDSAQTAGFAGLLLAAGAGLAVTRRKLN